MKNKNENLLFLIINKLNHTNMKNTITLNKESLFDFIDAINHTLIKYIDISDIAEEDYLDFVDEVRLLLGEETTQEYADYAIS